MHCKKYRASRLTAQGLDSRYLPAFTAAKRRKRPGLGHKGCYLRRDLQATHGRPSDANGFGNSQGLRGLLPQPLKEKV
jgi:hypothetical protein